MVDTQYLDEYIAKSGLKTSFICEKLGLSRQGFYSKCKNRTKFRVSEIYVLCDLLHIPENEKQKVFFLSN